MSESRILILGGGFGGIAAARELARSLPGQNGGSITVVDRHNFFLFTPMLTEVASGEIDTRHIVNPIRGISPRIRFEQGRVDGVDLKAKRVTITVESPVGHGERKTLEADHIVLALGSISNFHHIPGLAAHALTMKSLGDAVALRNRVLRLLEQADAEDDTARRLELLTFVVGGGGFSGVETMAALNDFARASLRLYPRVRERDIRMILVASEDRLLSEIKPQLAAYALKKLRRRGVDVRLRTRVTGANPGSVEIDNGAGIPTRTIVWTGGVSPSPLIGALDCRKSKHGAVLVDHTCAVLDTPGIWAIGDCAAVPRGADTKPGAGDTYGPTAQNATREGKLVAGNIMAALRGEKPARFKYRPMGELAIVGRHTGVAQIYGIRFSGILAWAMWRGVYLFKLPRVAKKVRVAIDWTLDLAFGRDISALPLEPERTGSGSTRQATAAS
jgi:NADH dehydrogenase